MAFTNQTTTSMSDFLDKLASFLSTNGWTTSHTSGNGRFFAQKTSGSVDVGFGAQYDTGGPNNLGIYHYHGAAFNSSNNPWAQNDDSGNGFAGTADASLNGQRHANISNSPVQFWCFEEDFYFHVVLQRDANVYQHFGAGQLVKYGDGGWTGGEYVYGHRQQGSFNNSVAVLSGTSVLLDGLCADAGAPQPSNMEEYAATIRVESLPNQPAGGKYAVNMGNQPAANLGQDRQSTPVDRVHFVGGFRGGLGVKNWGVFHGNTAAGLLPGYPINVGYFDRTTGDVYAPLGRMPDVRGMSIRDYVGGQEITVGGDTWVIFPTHRKGTSSLTSTSAHQGIIYKKIP